MLNSGRQAAEEAEQRFDSEFERDVFQLISGRGFHVRTQVCVGDPANHRYRIDLVVEGMQGRLAVECDGDERYEQDMARQRDLERAGWQFVRIRGGDFYRDRERATAPLWAELNRLGIKPGIDQAAAEPPPSADSERMERREVEEIIPVAPEPVSAEVAAGTVEAVRRGEATEPDAIGEESVAGPAHFMRSGNSFLGDYISYNDKLGPDPRTVNITVVADHLCRIIEVEGPMIAKRAYYLFARLRHQAAGP
jgi:very-short-patch-repair endonuclease